MLYGGLALIFVLCCCCGSGMIVIGTFCWLRLRYHRKTIDYTIHEILNRQKSMEIAHDQSITVGLNENEQEQEQGQEQLKEQKIDNVSGNTSPLRLIVASKSSFESELETEEKIEINEIGLGELNSSKKVMSNSMTPIPGSPVSTIRTHATAASNSTTSDNTTVVTISSSNGSMNGFNSSWSRRRSK